MSTWVFFSGIKGLIFSTKSDYIFFKDKLVHPYMCVGGLIEAGVFVLPQLKALLNDWYHEKLCKLAIMEIENNGMGT